MEELIGELENIETELERINVLDSKWQFVNEKIATMKQMVSVKTTGVTEECLSQIIDEFLTNLLGLNDKLASVIDESIALAEQKTELQDRYVSINEELGLKGHEVEEWKELLGVSSNEDYQQVKEEILTALKENKKKYAKYSKVESLCKEWQKRVTQGDGLLQESIADSTLVILSGHY